MSTLVDLSKTSVRRNFGRQDANSDIRRGRPRKFIDGVHHDRCYLEGYNEEWDWHLRGGAGQQLKLPLTMRVD